MRHITSTSEGRIRATLLMGAVFTIATLSGCIGATDDEISTNLAPQAVLSADRTERWAGERFTFSANGSADPDGEITRYHFDFGDGHEATYEDAAAAAEVPHRYATGGLYVVTLTLTDDGGNLSGKATGTASQVVAVHQRDAIPFQVAYAAPSEGANVSRTTHAFEVGEHADTYEAELRLASMIPLGDSEITLRVLGPDEAVVHEENVTLAAGQNETVTFAGDLLGNGTHLLEMVVQSGGASIEGELRVYYAATD